MASISRASSSSDGPLHEQPTAGGADLALVGEDPDHRAFDGPFEIGVGEDDLGLLPPSSRPNRLTLVAITSRATSNPARSRR